MRKHLAFACYQVLFFLCSCSNSEPKNFAIFDAKNNAFSGPEKEVRRFKTPPQGNYKIYQVEGLGSFYIDSSPDTIKDILRTGKPWEPELVEIMQQYIIPSTTVLDVGAHIGTHTVSMSKLAGSSGCVIAIEPQKKIFSELAFNLTINKCHNVKAYCCAVGDHFSTIEMDPATIGNEGGTMIGHGGDIAEMITIDSLKLDNVSFIKIDTENFEEQVLAGTEKTIRQNRPYILIEIMGNGNQPITDREARTQRVLKQLQNLGYVLKNIRWYDWLAIPQEKLNDPSSSLLFEKAMQLHEPLDGDRALLYMAESYKDLKDYPQAIKYYQARIDKGGSKQIIRYSHYMIGESYQAMGQWDQALPSYLEAYQVDPTRLEALKKITSYYRLNSQNDLAYLFAKQGENIASPSDYQLDEELAIAAFYTPFKEDGYRATNNLMLKKELPPNVKEWSYKNVLFYVENLPFAQFLPIDFKLPPIHEGSALTYNAKNPTIQKTKKGYKIICGAVNYQQLGAKEFLSLDSSDPQQTIRSKNYLIECDRNFKVLSQSEIVENLPRPRNKTENVEGLIDPRLFEYNNSYWIACTTPDTNPKGAQQLSLGKLANKTSQNTINVEQLIPLKGPDPLRIEKNWMPLIKNNELYLIYSYDPFIVYKPDLTTGECETILSYVPHHDFSHFRGSAAPIEFDDGYLMLVHEVVLTDQYYYLHRFLYLDKNLHIQKVSKPFTFHHKGVEFCCGMTVDHMQKNLVLAVGLEDREAYVGVIDLTAVRSMLESLRGN